MKLIIDIDNKTLEEETRNRIGSRIRSARKQANLSLNDLYKKCGVSASTIHKIENYSMTPTVTTLHKIAMGLGKNLNFFLDREHPDLAYHVTRKGEGTMTTLKPQKNLLRSISANFENARLEVLHNIIEKGGKSGKNFITHNSEEVTICLGGTFEFEIDNDKILLEPMDSIHIDGGCPHRWKNPGRREAEVLFIFSPPLFQPNEGR